MEGNKTENDSASPRADQNSTALASLVSLFLNDSSSNLNTILNDIVQEIEQGSSTGLRDLVDLLGEHLTSQVASQRTKGMSLLSWVVTLLQERSVQEDFQIGTRSTFKFEPELVSTLAEFFLERIDDRVSMGESLEALRSLVETSKLSKRLCESVARRVFCDINIHVQSLPQLARRSCYQLLKALVEDEVGEGQKAVRSMKSQIVYGFIQAMDGEKEPRNLLLALLLFPRLTQLIPEHVEYEEDLFEITSCYFPVTFSEKADDPFAIKKQSLVKGLRRTMISSTEFWIPFLLEKLASSLIETKLEVLESIQDGLTFIMGQENASGGAGGLSSKSTISNPSNPNSSLLSSYSIEQSFKRISLENQSCPMWRFDQLTPHLPTLSQALIKEIMNTTDTHVSDLALQVLSHLVRFVSLTSKNGSVLHIPSPTSRLQALIEFVNPILNNCLKYFGGDISYHSSTSTSASNSSGAFKSHAYEMADSKMTATASKIIQALAAGSEQAATLCLKRFVPILEAKFLNETNSSDRASTIRHLLNLTRSTQLLELTSPSASATESSTTLGVGSNHPIVDYAVIITRIMQSCCLSTTAYPQEKSDALEALALLSLLDEGRVLSVESNSQIIQAACQIIIGEDNSSYSMIDGMDSPQEGQQEVVKSAIMAISKMSQFHPTLVINHGLSMIFNKIKTLVSDVLLTKETKEDVEEQQLKWTRLVQLIASLHALSDPQSLMQSISTSQNEKMVTYGGVDEYDKWKEIQGGFKIGSFDASSVAQFVQNELFELLMENYAKSHTSRLSSIILSSLSRTFNSIHQFKQIWTIIMAHFDVLDAEKCHVLRCWLPILAQNVNLQLPPPTNSKPHQYDQLSFLKDICHVFMEGKVDLFILKDETTQNTNQIEFAPFNTEKSADFSPQRCLIPILSSVVCSSPIHLWLTKEDETIQPSQALESGTKASLLNQLLSLLTVLFKDIQSSYESSHLYDGDSNLLSRMDSEPQGVFESVVFAFCSILNKIHFNSSQLDSFIQVSILTTMFNDCTSYFQQLNAPNVSQGVESEKQAQILLFSLFWICKSLIQRNHPKSKEMSSYLMNMLNLDYSSDRIRKLVAEKFEILFLDSVSKLPKAGLLYKQKLWTSYLPWIESISKKPRGPSASKEASLVEVSSAYKSSLILAFSGLIKHLPKGVLIQSIDSILPIWIEALGSEGGPMNESAVCTLETLLKAPQILPSFEPHLQSIIPALISIGSSGSGTRGSERMSTCAARLASTQCLIHLLQAPYAKIYPYRNAVVDGLERALDDRKRVVRKAVVQTRNEWFLIGTTK